MSGEGALTEAEAHAIYDVLVQHAGEHDPDGYERRAFVYNQTRRFCGEYRFQGALGFGGKFWRSDGWRVNCYPEDRTPERESVIEATNTALSGLYAAACDMSGGTA